MFTLEQLIATLPRLATLNSPPFECVEFSHQDFEPASSEQYIWAFRGFKKNFASALVFWVTTLRAQGWEGREFAFSAYARSGLCKPMTQSEFIGLVADYTGSLRRQLPQSLEELSGFQSALRMYADWNDVAAVAELDDAFVAFYWSTTA